MPRSGIGLQPSNVRRLYCALRSTGCLHSAAASLSEPGPSRLSSFTPTTSREPSCRDPRYGADVMYLRSLAQLGRIAGVYPIRQYARRGRGLPGADLHSPYGGPDEREFHDLDVVVFDAAPKGSFIKSWGKEFKRRRARPAYIRREGSTEIPVPVRHQAWRGGEGDPRRRGSLHSRLSRPVRSL